MLSQRESFPYLFIVAIKMDSSWKLKCINPLNKNDHPASKNLSDFSTLLRSAYPLVPVNAKIYSTWRRQIYKQKSSLFQSDAKK